jgi:hypothetical protein
MIDRVARSQMDAAELPAEPRREPTRAPVGQPGGEQPGGLTERELAILAFERQFWKYAGAKEQAIRELFNMSAMRYYQLLNNLIEKREAVQADPMLVKRIRRLRAGRQRARAARRLGFEKP